MSTARGLTMVRASAGSGKTFRLTEEVCRAVATETPVEGLVAVTFTIKAAAELEARIRRALVEQGAFDRAQRLPIAHVGTVHAVCLRLLKELALDAGLSPRVDVFPEADVLLREALEDALDPDFRGRMDELAAGLGVERDEKEGLNNWLWPVAEIMELARANRIRPGDLSAMAERSVRGLSRLLPEPALDGAALDGALRAELTRAMQWLPGYDDGAKKTSSARDDALEAARGMSQSSRLPWPIWAKLEALSPGSDSIDRFRPIVAAASEYARHPAFHDALREITILMFRAAQKGLESFASWKRERGLVDFVDMVDHALELIERPEVAQDLRERLRLVVVDEFQDTSPLQLALFTRLHAIAGRSIWVGDRKQCIFEFAGADPALIDAVASWAKREGGAADKLPHNRRSRPELVDLQSALFAAALAPLGYEAEEVVVAPHRTALPELANLPPLGLFSLDLGSRPSNEKEAAAVAEGVRRLLETPGATPIIDRPTGNARDLRPGDIAVLVDTNENAEKLAAALAERGVAAAVARSGLLATPEGTLVDAALRWLLDPGDTLSEAVLEALFGFSGKCADEWLADRLERAASNSGEIAVQRPARLEHLSALRERLDVLSPVEALDLTLQQLDALGTAAAWPEPSQRRSNLDALRALASRYEERCEHRREAATIAGLLRFFGEARDTFMTRAGKAARDDQHVATGGHAVTVCTYHKSKGLEWPVVVMASLSRAERRNAFGVHPESEREGFDPKDPLGGRAIRYWPRPMGKRNVPLIASAAASPEGQGAANAERHERVRLLYVGMTRARDHLILAARFGKSGPSVAWLDDLADASGRPLLDLAVIKGEGPRTLRVTHPDGRDLEVAVRAWTLGPGATPPARLGKPEALKWLARPDQARPERARYRIAPSRAALDWPALPPKELREIVRLGPPLAVARKSTIAWSAVGDATHAFLACDDPTHRDELRRERAKNLLASHDCLTAVFPESLLAASSRFRVFVDARWPTARWHRELPVEASVRSDEGARLVSGTIDLLLETPEGLVLIDHKTSQVDSASDIRTAATEYAPQLSAYAEAICRATGEPVAELWLNFVLGGWVARLEGPAS